MAPQLTGTMVIDTTSVHPYENSNGGVARVHLYGPRGGDAGSVLIGADSARESFARLGAAIGLSSPPSIDEMRVAHDRYREARERYGWDSQEADNLLVELLNQLPRTVA